MVAIFPPSTPGGVAVNGAMQNRSSLSAAIIVLIISGAIAMPCLIAECESGTTCTSRDDPLIARSYRQGRWYIIESNNFQVCCDQIEAPAAELARRAEELRTSLCDKWLGTAIEAVWNPRCQVLLYSSQRNYVAALGRGSEHTVGSSVVTVKEGRITSRRIDLVGGATEYLKAGLPHELTHVVLRERFLSVPPPRWADEGMAILADTDAKQGRHFKDLREAVDNRTVFRAADLFAIDEYPGSDRMGTFYGQSVSLTKFLVARKSPQLFVQFIDRARTSGYDAALKECYGIANVPDLDHQWQKDGYSIQLAFYETSIKPVKHPLLQTDHRDVPLASFPVPTSRPKQ